MREEDIHGHGRACANTDPAPTPRHRSARRSSTRTWPTPGSRPSSATPSRPTYFVSYSPSGDVASAISTPAIASISDLGVTSTPAHSNFATATFAGQTSSPSSEKKAAGAPIAAIVGGVVGGIGELNTPHVSSPGHLLTDLLAVVIAFIALGIFFLLRKKSGTNSPPAMTAAAPPPPPPPMNGTGRQTCTRPSSSR